MDYLEPVYTGAAMMPFAIKGRYTAQVCDADGHVLREVATDNRVVQSGMDTLLKHPASHGFALAHVCERCWIGNGTGAPALSDTGLQNALYDMTNALWHKLELKDGSGFYDIVATREFEYPNRSREYFIWEVGTSASIGTPWFSRALLPSAVVVKTTEQLKVVFEVTLQVSTQKFTASLPYDGANLAFSVAYAKPAAAELAALVHSTSLVPGALQNVALDIHYPGTYWDSGIPGVGAQHYPPWQVVATELSWNAASKKYAFALPLNLPPVPIAAIDVLAPGVSLPMRVEFATPPRLNADQYFAFEVTRFLRNA